MANVNFIQIDGGTEHEPTFNTGLDEEMYQEFWVECACGEFEYCSGTQEETQKAWDGHIDAVLKEWAGSNGASEVV